MKLIDGHAMIQRVEALYKRGAVDLSYYNIVKEAVQLEPAVDAVPVVHGRWIFHDDDVMPWVSCSECSICTDSTNETPYCPRCGAKMDGDEDGKA